MENHLYFFCFSSGVFEPFLYEPGLDPSGTSSLQGAKNRGENLVKLDVSQSFICKF